MAERDEKERIEALKRLNSAMGLEPPTKEEATAAQLEEAPSDAPSNLPDLRKMKLEQDYRDLEEAREKKRKQGS